MVPVLIAYSKQVPYSCPSRIISVTISWPFEILNLFTASHYLFSLWKKPMCHAYLLELCRQLFFNEEWSYPRLHELGQYGSIIFNVPSLPSLAGPFSIFPSLSFYFSVFLFHLPVNVWACEYVCVSFCIGNTFAVFSTGTNEHILNTNFS